MVKIILLFFLMLLSHILHAEWYESKVNEVSAWGNAGDTPILFVRTDLNPNPANCPGTWAGSAWVQKGESMNLAASIALSAKATGDQVRFHVVDNQCSTNGLPIIDWIQIR